MNPNGAGGVHEPDLRECAAEYLVAQPSPQPDQIEQVFCTDLVMAEPAAGKTFQALAAFVQTN